MTRISTEKEESLGACFMFVFWPSVRITISAPFTLRQQTKQSGLSERTNEDVQLYIEGPSIFEKDPRLRFTFINAGIEVVFPQGKGRGLLMEN
jgi:hypothetical protein